MTASARTLSIEETLLANGMAPNRKAGQKGVPQRG